MSDIINFEKLQLKPFRKFSEKISAIAYHKGKIAVALASSNQRIEVWNYKSNKCELTINTNGQVSRCVKFDDTIIMSMFEEIRSWELPSGAPYSVFRGGVFRCCSFDYSNEHNIVVGSFSDSGIHIWNMSTGNEVKCLTQDQGSVQRVSLYPVLSNEPQNLDTVYMLVLNDKEVEMWTLRFDPAFMNKTNMVTRKVNTVRPYCNPLREPGDLSRSNDFRFKNEFLYYVESSADSMPDKIVVWDMRINLLHNKIKVSRCIKNLLAFGNKYIAFQAEVPVTNEESFVIIDRETEAEVQVSELPGELQEIGADGYPSVIIGETSWLDGLNEENKHGIFCISVSKRQTVNVLEWVENDLVAPIEPSPSGYCNLL